MIEKKLTTSILLLSVLLLRISLISINFVDSVGLLIEFP